MINHTLRQNLQCSLVVHCILLEALFIFLIALIPHGRRYPQLVKDKVLGPRIVHLHHQFLARITKNAIYPGSIGQNALQEDAPTPAIVTTTVQLESSGPIRIAKIAVWRLTYAVVLGLQYFKRTPRFLNIHGKNCLPFSLQLLWELHVYVFLQ